MANTTRNTEHSALIPPIIFSLYFVFSSFLPQVKHVTDQQWVKVHPVASPRKAKQCSKGSLRQLFLIQRNHTNHLILQDWNPCSEHGTNQNHHQLDQKRHTIHHRALRPNKITLPRC